MLTRGRVTIPAALVGQVQDSRTAAGGVALPLDPAGVLQPIDDPGEGDRLDCEALGIEGLVLVRLPREAE
ncbi:hypothetical protein OPU67_05250 [Erythrobacter sp. WG]|nr:hypothetical protein [Erythrobacter sp. WG]MCX9146742.1 hypothetical protein [Erythrobacter sp. WG]